MDEGYHSTITCAVYATGKSLMSELTPALGSKRAQQSIWWILDETGF